MPQALLISALGFAFATATDRGDDMVLTMLARGCQAIRDLGTLELVGQYASGDDGTPDIDANQYCVEP